MERVVRQPPLLRKPSDPRAPKLRVLFLACRFITETMCCLHALGMTTSSHCCRSLRALKIDAHIPLTRTQRNFEGTDDLRVQDRT